ncbi:hypothetical protein [Acidovorax sp. A1169]|uniref:hypothetical protein n=1 Tax=Acidovorax sp. A1169 TaxID=3059524 RepID=UPI002737B5A7|nr:hypothetical protein [Acidovorax sp. A1169]MDP4074195.1 hypothetical protein [Acidovorax sp. A1169]
MSAQDGGSLVLDYGPQGAQQDGGALVLDYADAATRRRVVASLHAPWVQGHAVATELRAPSLPTDALDVACRAPWGRGHAVQAEQRAPWVLLRRVDDACRAPWGRYTARPAQEPRAPWGVARRLDDDTRAPWGSYAARPAQQPRMPWGVPLFIDLQRRAPWGQYAARPARALQAPWVRVRRVDLEQWLPWTKFSRQLNPGWGVVVPGGEPPVDENGTVIVPVRKVYVVKNEITLMRVDGGLAIPAYAFQMGLDADSWTWSWSATVPASALDLVQPGPDGDPIDVLATVNGVPFRLAAEEAGEAQAFANNRVTVKGRGRAAVLDDLYSPVLNHGNSSARTAQQLMGDVLTLNGVPLGWDVDWGITDWLVPGNVWTHQGAYMSALRDIAEAAGAYLQPHDTDPTLLVRARYPLMPRDWTLDMADVELPGHVAAEVGREWMRKPAYDRVHVSGTTAGVLAEINRTGGAGVLVAPMVTHPLITHVDAARQRGLAVLADTGRQAQITLRLQVLEETGVIKPGAMVRFLDRGTTRLGLVRSTSLEWSRPSLRQTITLETHPD